MNAKLPKIVFFAPLAILVVLIGCGLFYAGFWYGKRVAASKRQVEETKPTPSTQEAPKTQEKEEVFEPLPQPDKTKGWQTYVNQRFHYSLEYPPELVLEPLGEDDNPYTEAIEVGDEGTVISEAEAEPGSLRKSMFVTGFYLTADNESLSLKEFVKTQGSFTNPCHEDTPYKTEEVISQSGEQGIKAWYFVKQGCQGAKERGLNDPSVFFDDRARNNILVEFFEGQMDEYFDEIVSTFSFVEALEYGD